MKNLIQLQVMHKTVHNTQVLRPYTTLVPHSVYDKMLENQEKQKRDYDKTAVKKEEVFQAGDKVWVQDTLRKTWDEGMIVEKLDQPRSYTIQIKNKGIKRRNQIHIRKRN